MAPEHTASSTVGSTFEFMRSFWPQVADPNDAAAAALDGLPKHVSSTLQDSGWNG
jgi:hypothetical protein